MMYVEWYGVCNIVISAVEICVYYGGVYVFHVCFDLCVVYGIGICVDVSWDWCEESAYCVLWIANKIDCLCPCI